MRDDLREIVLTFPAIPFGERETAQDLTRLIYLGGAAVRLDKVQAAIRDGILSEFRTERLGLVHAIHEVISGKLAGGGSPKSAKNQIQSAVKMFAWAEAAGASLTLDDIQATYLSWVESLVHRSRVSREISERAAYCEAMRIGSVLDAVLSRQKPLLRLTRLTLPKPSKAPLGAGTEKQNLQATFAFGRLLQDVCDALTLRVVWEVRDVEIPHAGGVLTVWTGGSLPQRKDKWANWECRKAEARKTAYAQERNLEHRGRRAVVNTRILAELLMFIAQTGMNLAQAHKLTLSHFNYTSDIDGYKVRDYKQRRGGEVLFEIFRDYRAHFERYLEWRRDLFPNSKEIFPVMREGSRVDQPPRFDLIQVLCKQAGCQWTPPSVLRGTRVNWLLRRSGDPDLTAEMAQHTKKVLLDVYERPSFQRGVSEVARFWQANDPFLVRSKPLHAVAPGACDGKPMALPDKPPDAPAPDCIRPSGCLWCDHHRDIDSQDYVWSLACFRHLKTIEVSKHCFPVIERNSVHPAQHAVDRASQKLGWFKSSNEKRRGWVEEALARVEEGDYHGDWVPHIQAVEGTGQ